MGQPLARAHRPSSRSFGPATPSSTSSFWPGSICLQDAACWLESVSRASRLRQRPTIVRGFRQVFREGRVMRWQDLGGPEQKLLAVLALALILCLQYSILILLLAFMDIHKFPGSQFIDAKFQCREHEAGKAINARKKNVKSNHLAENNKLSFFWMHAPQLSLSLSSRARCCARGQEA